MIDPFASDRGAASPELARRIWRESGDDPLAQCAPTANAWTQYPMLACASFEAALMELHGGREAEFPARAGELVYLVVEGQVTFDIGGQRYGASFADLVSVPAGCAHAIINDIASSAFLCRISGEGSEHPQSMLNPEHLKWDLYRHAFTWTLPLADREGHRRGSGPSIRTNSLRGHTVTVPPGQAAPWHDATRDLLFMPLTGTIDVQAANQHVVLGSRDMLLMPAYKPYSYSNRGTVDALLLSIGPNIEAQATRTYFASDPGWPVRADAVPLAL